MGGCLLGAPNFASNPQNSKGFGQRNPRVLHFSWSHSSKMQTQAIATACILGVFLQFLVGISAPTKKNYPPPPPQIPCRYPLGPFNPRPFSWETPPPPLAIPFCRGATLTEQGVWSPDPPLCRPPCPSWRDWRLLTRMPIFGVLCASSCICHALQVLSLSTGFSEPTPFPGVLQEPHT